MEIIVRCPQCRAQIGADSRLLGQRVECPECHGTLEVTVARPEPGQVIHGYRIDEPLGEGPLGEVFMATQLSMERKVVFKALPRSFCRDPENVEAFLGLIQGLAQADHPCLVHVIDSGVENGLVFLVIGFVEGYDVAWHLDMEGPTQEYEALEICREIATALREVHEKTGLVHGDIKPSNILITAEGDAKLLNFGIHPAGAMVPPYEDDPFGPESPYYTRPRGDKIVYDVPNDIYALGCTFYHMICGDVPFPGETAEEVFSKSSTGRFISPRDLDPSICEATELLLRKWLRRHPDKRYNTWDELLGDINSLLAGTVPETLLPGAASANISVPRPLNPDELVAEEVRHARRRRLAWWLFASVAGLALLALVAWFVYSSFIEPTILLPGPDQRPPTLSS